MAARKKKNNSIVLNIPKLTMEVRDANNKKMATTRAIGPFKLMREHIRNDNFAHEETLWNLSAKIGKQYRSIGTFSVMAVFSNNKLTVAISGSEIDDENFRGYGIAKRAYRLLANYYGGLESDPNGTTSNDAKRVWKSLKAKSLPGKRFRIEAEKKK